MASLGADVKQQLRRDYKAIGKKYASYVRCIRMSPQVKNVSAKDLYSFLLSLPFEYDQSTAHELKKAKTVEDIFNALENYFSFWDHEIFRSLMEEYGLDERSNEKLQYVKHFDSYIRKHNVSEFVAINPQLAKHAKDSKRVTLKFDIDAVHCGLDKVSELKLVVANSLNLRPSALRLLSIQEGCVEVTYLIPAPKADAIFTGNWKQISEQSEELQAVSVLSVTCNNSTFDTKERKLTTSECMEQEVKCLEVSKCNFSLECRTKA